MVLTNVPRGAVEAGRLAGRHLRLARPPAGGERRSDDNDEQHRETLMTGAWEFLRSRTCHHTSTGCVGNVLHRFRALCRDSRAAGVLRRRSRGGAAGRAPRHRAVPDRRRRQSAGRAAGAGADRRAVAAGLRRHGLGPGAPAAAAQAAPAELRHDRPVPRAADRPAARPEPRRLERLGLGPALRAPPGLRLAEGPVVQPDRPALRRLLPARHALRHPPGRDRVGRRGGQRHSAARVSGASGGGGRRLPGGRQRRVRHRHERRRARLSQAHPGLARDGARPAREAWS